MGTAPKPVSPVVPQSKIKYSGVRALPQYALRIDESKRLTEPYTELTPKPIAPQIQAPVSPVVPQMPSLKFRQPLQQKIQRNVRPESSISKAAKKAAQIMKNTKIAAKAAADEQQRVAGVADQRRIARWQG